MSNVYIYATDYDEDTHLPTDSAAWCDICAREGGLTEADQISLSPDPCSVCGAEPKSLAEEGGVGSYWNSLPEATRLQLEVHILPVLVQTLSQPHEHGLLLYDFPPGTWDTNLPLPPPELQAADVDLEKLTGWLSLHEHKVPDMYRAIECQITEVLGLLAQIQVSVNKDVRPGDYAVYVMSFRTLHALLHSVVRNAFTLLAGGYFDEDNDTPPLSGSGRGVPDQ